MVKETIPWWNTKFEEDEALSVYQAVKNKKLSMGSITKEFEDEISKKLMVSHAVGTTSGSTALLMALIAIGIKQDDEVIIPNRTWIASIHATMMLGAKPIILDVLPDIPVMDTSKIEDSISEKTKAIIPTQLNGRGVYMEKVWEIAKKYKLYVIEDAAQGLFSKYNGKFMGTQSDVGCFSMSVAKLLPTGQGGFLVSNNTKIYKKLLRIRTHGLNNFTHFSPFNQFGFNFRITDLQSSIGLVRLKKISTVIKKIIKIFNLYETGLKDLKHIKIIPVDIQNGQIPIYVEALSEDRQNFIKYLSSNNIETRTLYPDLDTAKYLNTHNNFPNSRPFGSKGLVLPCGPDQSIDKIRFVIDTIRQFRD